MARPYGAGTKRALLGVLVLVCVALSAPPAVAEQDGDLPPKCLVMKDGQLPACIQNSDGTWDVEYPAPGSGGFVALFVLAGLAGIGFTAYRVSMARDLARKAGLDPGQATAMTLLDDDGLAATYLASSLRPAAAPNSSAAPAPTGIADRMRELQSLLEQGLISQAEYEQRRKAIIDAI